MSAYKSPVTLENEKDVNYQQDPMIEQIDDIKLEGLEQARKETAEGHVHAKTVILLIATVTIYFVQVLHVAGNGLLSSSITAVTGGSDQAIWLVSTLAISAAALGAPISQASDYWGRKWLVVGFTGCGFVGCLVASRATSFDVVLTGQSIACLSLGAQPLVHAIASEIIPRKHRPFAQAAVNIASATGGAIGVTMGGALIRSSPEGFRVYFYITGGLYGVMALIVAWVYCPPPRELQLELTLRQKLAQLDWVGYALFVPGLILFSYALTSSTGVYLWNSSIIIATLVVGSTLLVMFALYEWRFTRTGMLHHGLFSRGRNFTICLFLIFTEGLAFFAANSFFAFENVVLYDRTFFHAGLIFTVVFWTANVATVVTGLYVSHSKRLRIPLIFATTSVTIFFASMSSLDLGSRWNPLGYAVLLGAGLGSALNTVIVTAQLSTPPELIALASGLMIAMRSTGGTVGLSVFQAIFGGTFGNKLAPNVLARVSALGFDPEYTGPLLEGLVSHNTTLIDTIPGITSQMIASATLGVKDAYVASFRNVWAAATGFACVALILSFFVVEQRKEFNAHIDAPVETEMGSRREDHTVTNVRLGTQA